MPNPFNQVDPIREEIARTVVRMAQIDPASKEYEQACANLKRLYEASNESKKRSISPETAFKVGAYVFMGFTIIGAELFGYSITTNAAKFAWPKIGM